MMRSYRFHLMTTILVLGCWSGGLASAQEDYRYAWFELPTVDDDVQFDAPVDYFAPLELVTGGSSTRDGTVPVLWDLRRGGIAYQLETLSGAGSTGRVNDNGIIEGSSSLSGDADYHAVIWDNLQIRDLGTLGGLNSDSHDINNVPQVVGESEYVMHSDFLAPFVWEDGEMRELPNLGSRRGGARAINERGQIVGFLRNPSGGVPAVIWENDQVSILPDLVPDSYDSSALDINDNGLIVGASTTSNGGTHAVIWVDREIVDIHDSAIASSSRARHINNHNQVVGTAGPAFSRVAYIWEQGRGMTPLDELVPPLLRLPWEISSPKGITDGGQIPITAQAEPGDLWAVLLSPVDPTMELSGPTPGVAGEVNTFEVTDAPPGAKVIFAYSRNGGGFRIPGCNLQKNALQLHKPKIVGSAIADANGNASIQRFVPQGAAGKIILFQAVVVNDCAISELVVHEFE